jgi:hypothetical protein
MMLGQLVVMLRELRWLLRRRLLDGVHIWLLLMLLLRVRVLMLVWVLHLVLGSAMVSRIVSIGSCWFWRRGV